MTRTSLAVVIDDVLRLFLVALAKELQHHIGQRAADIASAEVSIRNSHDRMFRIAHIM